MSPAEEKRQLRRAIRSRLPGPEMLRAESAQLCEVILRSEPFAKAASVAAYRPLPGEADLTPVLREVLASGRRLLLPRTEPDLQIRFCAVSSLDELQPDAWGIPSPSAELPEEEADLWLIPVCGIDPAGVRLGKGGGCYDRYGQAHPALLERGIPVALSCQLVPRVPREPHDLPFPRLFLPEGLFRLPDAELYSRMTE